jgi:hypothetical protein
VIEPTPEEGGAAVSARGRRLGNLAGWDLGAVAHAGFNGPQLMRRPAVSAAETP